MKVIIIGNGGHSKVIQDMISCNKEYQILAILDDKYKNIEKLKGIIYGPLLYLHGLMASDVKVVIAIGHNEIRRTFFGKFNLSNEQYVTVIHPTAVVSPSAIIGNGTVVMPHALVNAGATIGDHCIINTGAIVEHDNRIEDYAHISPNATLTGNVSIGEGVHIGASATVIPGIDIGSWSVIGAGSTVIEHIQAYSKAVGSPTRLLNENEGKDKGNLEKRW